jgi:hypothetical protein
MTYEAGEKVEYQFGGYILLGTVTERCGRGYMVCGLTTEPIFIREDNILGRWK